MAGGVLPKQYTIVKDFDSYDRTKLATLLSPVKNPTVKITYSQTRDERTVSVYGINASGTATSIFSQKGQSGSTTVQYNDTMYAIKLYIGNDGDTGNSGKVTAVINP